LFGEINDDISIKHKTTFIEQETISECM